MGNTTTKITYYLTLYVLVPIYKLWLRKIRSMENVPLDMPFIIAANHSSYYDALLIHSVLTPRINKKIHAFINSLYWEFIILRLFLDFIFIEFGEGIPVYLSKDRESKRKNIIGFKKALKYLAMGECVMLFPEGGRSKDGKLKKAYTGVARLAIEAKVPILLFGIIDSNKVLPKGKILPRFKRCEVKIGKLIYLDKHYNKKINNKILEQITRNIMGQIAKLIGQEYNY